MIEIDLDSRAYAYTHVADELAASIQAGEITSRLPPERALAREFGVSYQTLRRAIGLLRERGLLITRPGRGSFITSHAQPETAQSGTDPAGPDPGDEQAEDSESAVQARLNLSITIGGEQALMAGGLVEAALQRFLVSEHDLNTILAMTAQPADAVTFSDLSRNPRAVAERARRLGRLRVTHRDTSDFYLIAAEREEERDENLITASRMFAALARSPAGTRAVAAALTDVFPWARHLSSAECSEFAAELIAALSDAAELAMDGNAPEVISGWRATARVKADPSLHAQALSPTAGDFGQVEVLG